MREITVMELDVAQRREPIDICISIWVRWMHLQDHRESLVEGNLQDTKEFMRMGEAMDVMIDSLPRHEWWAIRKSQGMCTQWLFKDVSYHGALTSAKVLLEPKLRKNVYTRKQFN